jgi:hypothetical protein
MRITLCLAAAVLFPMAAYASFGGTPCQTYGCHLLLWTLIGFAWPIWTSSFIFFLLHAYFCNPARSKNRQMVLGGFAGVAAYELAAACAAYLAFRAGPVGTGRDYVMIGFAAVYVTLAIASVLYARSSPRQAVNA